MAIAVGTGGAVRVGYQVAARVGRWSLDGPDDVLGGAGWTVHAALEELEAFWLERAGGTVCLDLDLGPRRWRWPALRVAIAGHALTARTDARPEER